MNKLFTLIISVLVLASCNQNKAVIEANIEGAAEKEFVIKKLNINKQEIVDTIKTDASGYFKFKADVIKGNPDFFYIYSGDKKLASIILNGGEKVKLKLDTLGNNLSVEGYEEAVKLAESEKTFTNAVKKFDSLAVVFTNAKASGDTAAERAANLKLGSLYVKYKQAAIKSLYQNPKSITNVYLLYQKFPGELPVFGSNMDGLLFKRVYDSLAVVYPESKYLPMLKKESEDRQKYNDMTFKMMGATETSFPDIQLPDINGKYRSLTDLKGKVILLSFWTVSDVKQKMYNKELVDIYQKYNAKGFEIYQVAVDEDKTEWGRTVLTQKLPWISLCDGLGVQSPAVITYNITKVPTTFLIDKSGNIVAKDIFGSALDSKVASIL